MNETDGERRRWPAEGRWRSSCRGMQWVGVKRLLPHARLPGTCRSANWTRRPFPPPPLTRMHPPIRGLLQSGSGGRKQRSRTTPRQSRTHPRQRTALPPPPRPGIPPEPLGKSIRRRSLPPAPDPQLLQPVRTPPCAERNGPHVANPPGPTERQRQPQRPGTELRIQSGRLRLPGPAGIRRPPRKRMRAAPVPTPHGNGSRVSGVGSDNPTIPPGLTVYPCFSDYGLPDRRIVAFFGA